MNRVLMIPNAYVTLALLAGVLAAGCDRRTPGLSRYDEVAIAKSASPSDHPFQHPPVEGFTPPTDPAAPSGHPPAGEQLRWTTPEGWRQEAAQGMRRATLLADTGDGQVECSLIVLSGEAGGLGPNINRWIGQLGLDRLSDEAMQAFIERQARFETEGGSEGVLADLTTLAEGVGPTSESMVVGVVSRPGETVFAKMTGSIAALRSEVDRLRSLCVSFH